MFGKYTTHTYLICEHHLIMAESTNLIHDVAGFITVADLAENAFISGVHFLTRCCRESYDQTFLIKFSDVIVYYPYNL